MGQDWLNMRLRKTIIKRHFFPKVHWVLNQDNDTRAEYFPCECGCKNIFLDCINARGTCRKLSCIVHEMAHRIFDFLPNPFYEWLSIMLDITHGNQSELLYKQCRDVYEDSVVLYQWD